MAGQTAIEAKALAPLTVRELANVSVSGASGYVGSALIRSLGESGGWIVNALRHSQNPIRFAAYQREVHGDLLQPITLRAWPTPSSVVVHLAYMWHEGRDANLQATRNLVEACVRNDISRLVHVSTAAVVGRAATQWVDEGTPCHPTTEYGTTKLRIEDILRDGASRYAFDLVVLRPTSVFGPGGAPLRKLVNDLRLAPWVKSYFKTCLFGRRAMNLIQLQNVVAALRFLIDYQGRFDGTTLILSEDDEPENNFADVEATIRTRFSIPDYPIPIIPLPPQLLTLALRAMGRNIVNPYCRFQSSLIESLGFERPLCFKDGLKDYLDWYERDVMRSSTHSGPSV